QPSKKRDRTPPREDRVSPSKKREGYRTTRAASSVSTRTSAHGQTRPALEPKSGNPRA
ncbi:hypothetical protein A2U01_0096169, partial [Trifolium medium]|nr:hypothetical protein [Trifolium medium]